MYYLNHLANKYLHKCMHVLAIGCIEKFHCCIKRGVLKNCFPRRRKNIFSLDSMKGWWRVAHLLLFTHRLGVTVLNLLRTDCTERKSYVRLAKYFTIFVYATNSFVATMNIFIVYMNKRFHIQNFSSQERKCIDEKDSYL